MMIIVNGQTREVAATTVAALLVELDYAAASVATALNRTFVRTTDRQAATLAEGDAVEILTPRQGG